MSQDDIYAEMEARRRAEMQRMREREGINAAAEAGVFDTGEPPELALVRERDRQMAEKFEREANPQNYTAIPVVHQDGAEWTPKEGPATHQVVVAADWDAPLASAPVAEPATAEIPPAQTNVGDGVEQQPPPASRMLRGLVAPPEEVGILEPPRS